MPCFEQSCEVKGPSLSVLLIVDPGINTGRYTLRQGSEDMGFGDVCAKTILRTFQPSDFCQVCGTPGSHPRYADVAEFSGLLWGGITGVKCRCSCNLNAPSFTCSYGRLARAGLWICLLFCADVSDGFKNLIVEALCSSLIS
jgi:hypothetical protein